jgi:hypothetical protein
MGMDVFGKAPVSETGSYFRRSVWGWHPLWDLCVDLVPYLGEAVQFGHSNDGDGLDAEGAAKLAQELGEKLADGTVERYCQTRDAAIAALPDEECRWCKGTGTRTDEVGVKFGYDVKGWCNGCDGKGKVRPFSTSYTVNVQDVEEWVAFLADSGGFAIH